MRRTLIAPGLRVLAILAVGALAGRFLIPLVEPHEVSYVAIYAKPDLNTCTLHMEHVTTFLGRQTLLVDEVDALGCSQSRDFSGASIQCRCKYWDDRPDGGE